MSEELARFHRDRFVFAEDFDTYLDGLFIDSDTAEVLWEDVADADRGDPWRHTVEQWLDHGLPRWRYRPWAAA